MREMYLSEPGPFDGILDGLSRLESEINRIGRLGPSLAGAPSVRFQAVSRSSWS
jgi:hypothetical protein